MAHESFEPLISDKITYPWPSTKHKVVRYSWYEAYTDVRGSFQAYIQRGKKERANWTWLDYCGAVLPCINWLRTYNLRQYLLYDIMAGVAVAFTLVPQGMSYAGIAGLPAVFGLYGGFTPLLIYAVFGSSRQLGVGPVAVTSTLISSGLASLAPDVSDPNNLTTPQQQQEQATYNLAVIQLAFLVSCLYTAIGVLQLGWIIRFISHSVITGFTSGAALIIASGQLKYIFGVSYKKQDTLQGELSNLIAQLEAGNFKWQEFVMGTCMIIFLLALRYIGQRWPRAQLVKALAPFFACVLGIIIVVATGSSAGNGPIKIVKNIPSGMPPVTIGLWVPIQNLSLLLPLSFMVMAIDMLESTSIARALARKNNYKLAFNQEITALGIANFFGAAFSAYTTTGSFSRSAINNSTGAKTQLAGFITGTIVMFVLLFLTQVFRLMPYNTMAAIIIVGVMQLFELGVAIELFRVDVRDFLVWAVAFLCTCFLGVDLGLAISIGVSLVLVVFQSAFPPFSVLGRVPKSTVFRNVSNYPEAETTPGIVVVRLDAPLWFANTLRFEEKLGQFLKDGDESSRRDGEDFVHYVVLEMSAVTFIDTQGAHTIMDVAASLKSRGVHLVLSNPNTKVARVLERMRIDDVVPRELVFSRSYDAVAYCRAQLSKIDAEKGSGSAVLVTLPSSEDSASSSGGAGDAAPQGPDAALPGGTGNVSERRHVV